MKREDVIWIGQRAVALYLVVKFVEAAPDAIVSISDPDLSPSEARADQLAAAVPLIAAIVLFEISRRRVSGTASGDLMLSTQREDLLWVVCKAFGLYLLMLAITSIVQLPLFFGSHVDLRTALTVGGSILCFGLLGSWLLFGERIWRLASRSRAASTPKP